jgi:hypothetical protein
MITSTQIITLSEQWVKTDISHFVSEEFDLYINPGSSDFLDIIKTARKDWNRKFLGIRFVANNNLKKVYVADASLALHKDIERAAGIPTGICDGTQIEGIAKLFGGKAVIEDFYDGGKNYMEKFKLINWSWVDKYISGCSAYIKQA